KTSFLPEKFDAFQGRCCRDALINGNNPDVHDQWRPCQELQVELTFMFARPLCPDPLQKTQSKLHLCRCFSHPPEHMKILFFQSADQINQLSCQFPVACNVSGVG